MTTLRPYQLEIYNEIPRRLKLGPVLVQAPARSGKSKIISETAARIIAAHRIPVVITHRDKIQRQLMDHCSGKAITAEQDHVFIEQGYCYVAMNQTLVKRPAIITQLQALGNRIVLMIDEAHRGDFCKLFDQLPAALRIGFTATPAWRWSKFLPTQYSSLIHGPQVGELVASGNITPIEYYEMRNELDELKKGSNGEYTEESQFKAFDKAKLYDGLFDQLKKFQFNKAIVFCASKKAADQLDLQMKAHNYRSTVYYSGLPKFNLAKFTELDEANVLITVSALSEGFDHPPIDFNILWRATTSLPLFIQMGMRGATPHPGKSKTTVLDFGGNNSRFGGRKNIQALTMDRDWNALWQPPEVIPKTGGGVAAIKNCPACDFIISAMAKSCCNCGYIYPEAAMRMKEGELIKIEHDRLAAEAAAQALTGRRISHLSPTELAIYAKEKNKKPFAARVAKRQEQQNPGWLNLYAKEMGYKSGWVKWQMESIGDAHIDFHDILIR